MHSNITSLPQQERRQLQHAITLSLSKKLLKKQLGSGGGGGGGGGGGSSSGGGGKTKKQKKKKGNGNIQNLPAAAAGGTLYTCPYCFERFANKGRFTSHVGSQCAQRYAAMTTVMPMEVDIDIDTSDASKIDMDTS